jgi:NAD-reducing hydrogenase large subunit
MERTIEINPVTRIEGHGKVTIKLDDRGNVSQAHFNVTQFRGFEKFCEGRVFWEMPVITPRTCGICPVSHHLAAAKACDAILGVHITPPAAKLRELMHMGQFIQSHALSFFHLSSPDLIFGFDSDPSKRNVLGLAAVSPDIARKAVMLRAFGQTVIQKLAGKRIHPNWAIAGGVNAALSNSDRDELRRGLEETFPTIMLGLSLVKDYYAKHAEVASSFANIESGYMGLVNDRGNGHLELYDGMIRLRDRKGIILEDAYEPSRYLDLIEERVEDWSYLKSPYYKKQGYPGGVYRVGPLARLNVADAISTPLANHELEAFRSFGDNSPVSGTLYYHLARLIELLYAAERARELLNDSEICSTDIQMASNRFNEEGIGVVEAPRGTLIHHYWVDPSGKITRVNLIVATGHNNAAMSRSVYEVAKQYIHEGQITEGILNRVEAAIRCYDPCLSCSTHTLPGQMPLTLEICRPDNTITLIGR